MPSREEIAAWLREAADQSVTATVDFRKRELFLQRAAQVAAMRCETCIHYQVHGDGIWCFNQKYPMCFIVKQDFGCFHHGQKV